MLSAYRAGDYIVKKIVIVSLSIFFIILFIGVQRNAQILESSVEVALRLESKSEFLSNDYFDELDEEFERVKAENDKWYVFDGAVRIAAKSVINQMMYDLEKEPKALINHKNFDRFFETFDSNIRKLDSITESMHFFRNTLNAYSDAPENLIDMIALAAKGKWRLFSAKFHRYHYGELNGALNIKFISADGRFEAVYNTGTGKKVVDPANMGTYNYAAGSLNPKDYYMHNKYDKKPWKKWGNIEGFSYQDILSLESGHGTEEADVNYREVEKLIKQIKDELE